jgi:hypothetical protein
MSNDLRRELKAAIDNLYTTFEHYKLRNRKLPRNLTKEDIEQNRYGVNLSELQDDWGDVPSVQYMHYLPLALDMIALHTHKFGYIDPGKYFAEFWWHKWPKIESHALNRYLFALWRYSLSEYPSPTAEPDDVLEFYWDMNKDIAPFLQIWEQQLDKLPALQYLVDCILGGDYNRISPIGKQKLKWLCRSCIVEQLANAFFKYEDYEFVDKFSYAVERLSDYPLD